MPAAEPDGAPGAAAPARLFGRWQGEPVLALAVSGGADSLALMLAADRWRHALAAPPRLVVLSVDHGLRPEAAAEVAMVGRLAGARGLAFRALRADGPPPGADIEAAARAMRYRLLFQAAREEGAAVVMTAHHADDQAETFLLRLARGSGVYGLAAMAEEAARDGMRLARPLLALRRAALAALVEEAGLAPVIDPHNSDPRFARARMRQLMPALAAEGLDAPALAATAGRMRRAAAAIDEYADRLFAKAAHVDATGAVRLDAAAFAAEPEETRLRALARILRAAGGAEHVPRLDSLADLAAAMTGRDALARRTLAGVVVDRRKGFFRFQREEGRSGLPRQAVGDGFAGVWDGRFSVRVEAAGPGLSLAPLGAAGRRALGACLPDGLPLAIAASPALVQGGAIVAAPPLGLMPPRGSGIIAEIRSIVGMRLLDRTAPPDL